MQGISTSSCAARSCVQTSCDVQCSDQLCKSCLNLAAGAVQARGQADRAARVAAEEELRTAARDRGDLRREVAKLRVGQQLLLFSAFLLCYLLFLLMFEPFS